MLLEDRPGDDTISWYPDVPVSRLWTVCVVCGMSRARTKRAKPKPVATPQSKAVMAQVDTLTKSIESASPSAAEKAMLAAIQRPWRTEAVYDKALVGKAPAAKPASLPRYTGYVELGSGRLAVVDGIEYQAGDTLEGGGYKVAAIQPDKLFLESLANGNRVEVPYEGQEDLAQ